MDPYIGEIRMFGGAFAPVGWALCAGQTLPIVGNEALYNLIGTTYGGDGQTSFVLPDLRSRIPLGAGRNPQTGTTFVQGQAGGTETVTLIPQQLPSHSHTARCQSTAGDSSGSESKFWAKTSGKLLFQATAANAAMAPTVTSSTGGGQPHDNVMPFLSLNFIIALEGIYPSQS